MSDFRLGLSIVIGIGVVLLLAKYAWPIVAIGVFYAVCCGIGCLINDICGVERNEQ